MGAPAQQPVYYDTENSQYYTVKPQQNNQNGYLGALPGAMFGGIPNSQNPFYASQMKDRNYIGGNPFNNNTYNPIQPDATIAPYPTTEILFPGLNAGLTQNIQGTASSMPSSGAGRFLSSGLLSNNTSKGQ
jgi:hypothetical protein